MRMTISHVFTFRPRLGVMALEGAKEGWMAVARCIAIVPPRAANNKRP